MKPHILLSLVAALFFAACGAGPNPETLEGDDEAEAVVNGFLTALQNGNLELAATFLHDDPDRILDDLAAARDLFFGIPSTGRKVEGRGHEQYGMDWHTYIDMKISYGDRMKRLRFTLAPGSPPKIRGLNPAP